MMGLSPHAYVRYECLPDPRGRTHEHLVPLGDGQVCVLGIEEAAELLAETVRTCGPGKHNGHGYQHGADEVELAYKGAVEQLLTQDFDAQERQQRWNRFLYAKWGGTPPAAVFMPIQDDPKRWVAVMPDPKTGDPVVTGLRKEFQEAMPAPEESNSMPDKLGIGFRRRPVWSPRRRLPRLLAIEMKGRRRKDG